MGRERGRAFGQVGMKLKVITLRVDPASGNFDDRALVEFQEGRDVIEASEHFLVHEKTPTLVLVLRYRVVAPGARPGAEAERKDWRAELDPEGKRMYDELRLWRGRKAKREGIPPYLILNNRELAELAARRPSSIAQLREIHGIGEAKAGRWGEEILAALAGLAAGAAGQAKPTTDSRARGGVAHGRRRAAALRPLGADAARHSLAHREVSQARALHHLIPHRQPVARHPRKDHRGALLEG
jgi:ATP-dependent DNA helicase RecQ